MTRAIGGYFELELPASQGERYPQAQGFQSARAAFLALLLTGKPSRVWVPWYLCDSMIEPLLMAGIDVARYRIDKTFAIRDELTLAPDEWLLYVNYFGICQANVERVLTQFPRHQVIIDNAQAFFSPAQDCLATIYSPRKFFGVPDGGYLVTPLQVAMPEQLDTQSPERCLHLLKRIALDPESGYPDYLAAEESLVRQSPRQMSRLTRRLLATQDYSEAHRKRRNNFDFLDQHLRNRNQFQFHLGRIDAPLCYLFRGARPGTREHLIRNRIFVPTYWHDVLKEDHQAPQFERSLPANDLCLPCDQRYDVHDMERIIDALSEEI